MSVLQDKNSMNRFAGEALFVSAPPASDAACANGSVFSFFHCAPVPQEPQISVLSDLSDLSDKSDYTMIVEAARDFRGWITVTAYAVVRNAVRAFRRVICEVKSIFNRRTLILQGGLRL